LVGVGFATGDEGDKGGGERKEGDCMGSRLENKS